MRQPHTHTEEAEGVEGLVRQPRDRRPRRDVPPGSPWGPLKDEEHAPSVQVAGAAGRGVVSGHSPALTCSREAEGTGFKAAPGGPLDTGCSRVRTPQR